MQINHKRRSLIKALSLAALGSTMLGGAAFAQENVTLSYALWDQAQVPAMQQIIDEFKQTHPNIDIKIQVTPWDDYWTKLQTSATGGSAPDVFWMTLAFLKLYASNGVLMSLDDKIKADGVDMANYVPAMAEAYKYDGVQYGMPKDVNAFGLFYNKDLFTAAGVAFPDVNWTWQNVIDAAQKLTDPAKGVYGIAAHEGDELTWYLTVPQAGGFVISDDGKSSGYDKPETQAGIKYWTDFVTNKTSPNLQQLTDTDALSMFTSGKVAMYYGGSWDPVAIADVPAAKAFTDVAPLPKGPAGSKFYSNGLANAIYANTPHPQEAWQFVNFLSSKRGNEIQAASGTVISAYNGQTAAYVAGLPWMNAQALIDQLPNALPFPVSENTRAWRREATTEFAKAWTGEETVEAASASVAQKMNEALAAE